MRDVWTDEHVRDLLDGPGGWRAWSNPWSATSLQANRTEAILSDMKKVWEVLRDELLPQWIEQHPGTRCWAWWAFEAKEARRLIRGPGASVRVDANAPAWAKRLEWGKPTMFSSPAELKSQWETERDYLERLGLLTDRERGLCESEYNE